jgi:serine/threonine-protein kinase
MTTDSEVPPSQGLVAGKYQLVRMIGRGGMGSVWEARHASLGTSSAIKFIEAEYADSQEARSRFDKEAKAAATIQSKHAIQIYDHGVTDDGKPYIVMELLQGEPLDKRIERLGRLSLQETAKIIQQVCRGLARAHERGIIHRDLKPENIFLVRTADDDDDTAKVLDFGIAKMNSEQNGGLTSSTKTGAVLGTPYYMSPEQARGLRNVDHRTDVWSLAVIAFKCVTGKLPFEGESVGDLLVKICTSPIPMPSQLMPGLPPNFDAWFMRAMEREPERRFSNVTELAEALCFAAGIATRSGQGSNPGTPYSHVPGGPNPYNTPMNLGTGPNIPHHPPYGSQPGAMTNAPFTKEHVPGVPSSGKGKLIGIGIAMLALGAGAVVGVKSYMKQGHAPIADSAQGVVMPPASVGSSAPLPVPPAATEKLPEPVASASVVASASPPAPVVKAGVKPPQTKPQTKPAPLPPPTTAPAPTPPPAPTTTPAPAPKKPNTKDPGY